MIPSVDVNAIIAARGNAVPDVPAKIQVHETCSVDLLRSPDRELMKRGLRCYELTHRCLQPTHERRAGRQSRVFRSLGHATLLHHQGTRAVTPMTRAARTEIDGHEIGLPYWLDARPINPP